MKELKDLIKLPVSVDDGRIIDADGLYILEVGVPYILTDNDEAIAEALCTLINAQNADVKCKAEKCEAPNCYEGFEPKGCLMEGAHPVADVGKLAEYIAEFSDWYMVNRHKFSEPTFKGNIEIAQQYISKNPIATSF